MKNNIKNLLSSAEVLTNSEEVEVLKQIMANDNASEAARSKFILSNLRLCYQIAMSYAHSFPEVEEEDLFFEGIYGLIKSIDKIDIEKCGRSSSFTFNWIRGAVLDYITKNVSVIKIPRKKRLALNDLYDRVGENYKDVKNYIENHIKDSNDLLLALESKRVMRLDQALTNDDEDFSYHDIIHNGHDEQDRTNILSDIDLVRKGFSYLKEKEKKVLMRLFGFDKNFEFKYRPQSMEEVGREFGVTRQRVEQIKVKALNKIRAKAPYGQN